VPWSRRGLEDAASVLVLVALADELVSELGVDLARLPLVVMDSFARAADDLHRRCIEWLLADVARRRPVVLVTTQPGRLESLFGLAGVAVVHPDDGQ
jgi:hypothetical protein